jgi:3-dehydroquinate synthase
MRDIAVDDVTVIPVGGEQPYEVLVGADLTERLPSMLPGAAQVAVLFTGSVRETAERAGAGMRAAGCEVLPIEVPDAEAGKTIDVAARCWDALGGASFTRSDAVIGVGGGATTDLAGFVAAGWLRGVRWVPVATSVLGMVDAAVGGKTGINTAAGKNLVGAFHPPAGVLCDLASLASLPAEERVPGLAEVVKCGFIADPVILDLVEAQPEALTTAEPDATRGSVLREIIERSIRVKARVVGEDLRESGLRQILNYGHTLGHAIEKVEGYRWRHGQAISVGLVYAAALARLVGRLDDATARRHRDILTRLGLPVTYPASAWPDLLATMRVDKKARGATLRFVVLDGLAQPAILEGPDDEQLAAAYREVSG